MTFSAHLAGGGEGGRQGPSGLAVGWEGGGGGADNSYSLACLYVCTYAIPCMYIYIYSIYAYCVQLYMQYN